MKNLSWMLCLILLMPLAAADDVAPAPPIALRAAETPGGVLLNWSAAPAAVDVDGFRVYRSDGSGFEAIAETTDSSYVDADGVLAFMPGEGMSYYVTAFNEAGESPPSNAVTGRYPVCWEVVNVPGPMGLPAWPALNCYLPPPFPVCGPAGDDLAHGLPVEIRGYPC